LALLDAWDVVTRRRPPMTPSRVLNDGVGGLDFHAVGEHLLGLLVDAAHFQPHERVLDVGCGVGRLAVPLTRYITDGEYIGFDVSRPAIKWCQRNIAVPSFTFTHVDVFNRHYNRRGKIQPTEFRFPSEDESIDVAFLASILTHLLPDAAAQYVAETSRVLKRGGRALMTFFLLDENVRENANLNFIRDKQPWWGVQDPKDPEAAVAYDLRTAEQALAARGLQIVEISRGAWSGHAHARSYQDVVIAVKVGSDPIYR